MLRPTRVLPSLVLALALAACTPPGVGPTKVPATPKPSPGKAVPLANAVATLIGMDGGSLIGLDGGSIVKIDGKTLIGLDGGSLIGQDGGSLIGQDGGSLIGQDGGSLIGQDGGSLVGNNGNALIGQDGGSLKGSVRAPAGLVAAGAGNAVSDLGAAYRLHAVAERPLAGVNVYLRHVDGRFFVDLAGKPITAVTDAKGNYDFKKYKAGRGLVVFVPSAQAEGEIRGLAGLHAKDLVGGVAIDLASSLTASWIAERVLAAQADKGASLDKLPAQLEAEARAKALAAIGDALPPGLAALARKAFSERLEALRAKDAPLADALRRVTEVMGQRSDQAGFGALNVALNQPIDVAVGPDGSTYVIEAFSGVLRRFRPDGKDEILLGPGSPSEKAIGQVSPSTVAVGPDGMIYVGAELSKAVYRVSPEGKVDKFAGGLAQRTAITPGMPATSAGFGQPSSLTFDLNGDLILCEDGNVAAVERILRVTPKGELYEEPAPWVALGLPPHPNGTAPGGVAVSADGTWWCMEFERAEIYMRPRGGAWRRVVDESAGLTPTTWSDLLPLPDGTLLVSTGERQRQGVHAIWQVDRDGKVTRWAGAGARGTDDGPAATAGFNTPSGLARRADGTVLVADRDNALVRAIAPDAARTVGVAVGVRVGNQPLALDAPLNIPGALALDAQGRILISEVGAHTVRRLEGDKLVAIAGGMAGRAGTGEPAKADRLLQPVGIAPRGDELVIAETGTNEIRVLSRDGLIRTVAGGAPQIVRPATGKPAREVQLDEVFSVAVAPDGRIHFFERDADERHLGHVWRIEADGRLTLVAGSFEGVIDLEAREGKPAASVRLGRLAGMAFDQAGNLYCADMAACQVVKIDPKGVMTSLAGIGLLQTAGKIIAGDAEKEPAEMAAKEAALLLPTSVACDAAGNVYVTELGTRLGQAVAFQAPEGMAGAGLPVLPGRIRKITPDGRIHTIAGLGAPAGAPAATNPLSIVVAPDGRLIFVENASSQIKILAR